MAHYRQLIIVLLFALVASAVSAQDFRVTLLGTGDPISRPDRFGPATLVQVAGQDLLFDVGRGAATRLVQMGVPLSALDATFLTHFHHDHLIGLDDSGSALIKLDSTHAHELRRTVGRW